MNTVIEQDPEGKKKNNSTHVSNFDDAADFYRMAIIPVILFDSNFIVTFLTNSSAYMFAGTLSKGTPFCSFVQQYMEESSYKTFLNFVQNRKCAYSWMGTLHIPSETTGMKYIRIAVQPLEKKDVNTAGYSALLQDATDEYMSFLKITFSSILEAARLKDNETGVHNERLNYYARAFSEHLFIEDIYPEIDSEFVEDISFLAAMHDVGKIGTPDDILKKNGPLTEREWSIMKEHTINGPFILATYPNPMARQIALSHHEHWDGKGYPYQLEGEMIPLSARIVAICDVYDALRMERNYKKGLPHEKTVEMIVAESGTHFDPALVIEFRKISEQFNEIWNQYGDNAQSTVTVHKRSLTS